MSLFDTDSSDKLLSLSFNKPSEKKAEQIVARRLCKTLGIDYASVADGPAGKNSLIAKVIEKYIELNPTAFDKVKGLMPSSQILAHQVRRSKPKTAYAMTSVLRGMAY